MWVCGRLEQRQDRPDGHQRHLRLPRRKQRRIRQRAGSWLPAGKDDLDEGREAFEDGFKVLHFFMKIKNEFLEIRAAILRDSWQVSQIVFYRESENICQSNRSDSDSNTVSL